jgi:hypothetical protein
MPPEETPHQIPSQAAAQEIEWDGPWGSIDPTPQSVETLCVQIEQEIGRPRIYYYPYRSIGKWNWSMGAPETLEIQAGGVLLTVSGSGLRRLAEALNMGQLRLVRVEGDGKSGSDGEICVRSILLDNPKS